MPLTYVCDFCERPLEIETVSGTDAYQFYTTKEWNMKSLYPCLCKSCAEKLDAAIKKVTDEAVLRSLIAARNNRLNAERKKTLRTKG